MSSDVLIAVAVFALGAYALSHLLRRVQAEEAKWFAAILQSSDEELSARPLPSLARDCSRMKEIRLAAANYSGAGSPWITPALADEQVKRLMAARDCAARRHHEAAVVRKIANP